MVKRMRQLLLMIFCVWLSSGVIASLLVYNKRERQRWRVCSFPCRKPLGLLCVLSQVVGVSTFEGLFFRGIGSVGTLLYWLETSGNVPSSLT